MAARPSWDGYLRLSLIAVPVKAYTAAAKGASGIGFHMIHKTCKKRIRYQKVCPVHGEVSGDEVVYGYEYTKGKYVVMDDDELAKLKGERGKSIDIDAFVPESAVDPLYYSGRSYYLVPDGDAGERSYAVLAEVMSEQECVGVAEAVMFGREQLGVVRSKDGLLMFSHIAYADEIRTPEVFAEDLKKPKISAEERRLAKTLVEASTRDELDLERYMDDSALRIQRAIEGKVKGAKVADSRSEAEPKVISLMDALRKSLHKAKPAVAAHRKTKKATSRRRKTG